MGRVFSWVWRAAVIGLLGGPAVAPETAAGADLGTPRLGPRDLARSSDYAAPRMAGTVSPTRIAAEGWQHCALTFDDGPNEITPRILAILDGAGVRATYFPVAEVAARHPEVIRGFVAGGHEIGNHSLRHANLSKMSRAAARADLAEANRVLAGLGARPALFRPPYAGWDAGVVEAAREVGLETVLWSLDVRDWEYRDAGMLAARVNAGARPATVVLLHATYEWTATALPQIIAALRNHGCRFVTLSDWLAFMRDGQSDAARPIPVAATADAAPAPASAVAQAQAPAAAAPPRPAAPRAAPARAPQPAARPTPTVTLRPATLAPARNNAARTELRIQGDEAFLILGPDADLELLAEQIKDALERPRAPKQP